MLSRSLSAQIYLCGGVAGGGCAAWAGDGPGAPCSLQMALLKQRSGGDEAWAFWDPVRGWRASFPGDGEPGGGESRGGVGWP